MKTRLTKTIAIGALAATLFTFTGCDLFDGIDEEQYHILTGAKEAEQIKVDYTKAWYQQNEEQKKIYAKWLDQYDDTDNEFNFNSFRISTRANYEQTLKDLQSAKIRFDVNTSMRELQKELRRASYFAPQIKYVKEVYMPYLKSLITQKQELEKTQRIEKINKDREKKGLKPMEYDSKGRPMYL